MFFLLLLYNARMHLGRADRFDLRTVISLFVRN